MKVIMKCVNIKHWDILGCFHYILNALRMFVCFFSFSQERRLKGIMFDLLQSPFCLCVCKIQTEYWDKQSVCFQKIDFPFSDIMRDRSPTSSLSSGPVLRHLTNYYRNNFMILYHFPIARNTVNKTVSDFFSEVYMLVYACAHILIFFFLFTGLIPV